MRFLALVFACLALGPPLIAQDSSAGPFTLNAANQCAEASVQGRATVVMYVSGTFSMTLQPKVAIQGQAASNTQVTPSTSTTAQSTITATGNYRADVAGQDLFQLCATSYSSGSAVIYFKMTGNISTGLLGAAATGGSVSGTGTANTISKWTGALTQGNSSITDDGTHSPTSPNGFDLGTLGALSNEIANNATTATVINKLACDDGTGKVLICSHLTSTANQPVGSVTNGAGTTGLATVAYIGFITVCFDNQSTSRDYAIASTTADGCLHDTGGTTLTAGQPNYFVWTANTGALTNGVFRLLTADDFTVASCATCVTAAAALTNNGIVIGKGGRGVATTTALPNGTTATTQTASDTSTKVSTTAYADTAVANGIAGVNPAVAVQAATTVAGDTSTFTYLNGVAGIGATLTGPTNNVAVAIDGFTFTAVGQRLLVKNDTQSPSGAFNGVYSLTVLQGVANKPVFTRALDYDMPSDINNTGAIPVINGTTNGTTQWVITSSVTTVGTDPLTYAKFSSNPANNVTAVSPGAGVAHFAGGTQVVTSSLVNLTSATDVTGTLPQANLTPVTLPTPGTSVSLAAPSEIYICTSTCTVTPPVPAAGYQFCVMNDDNVATVITLAAIGSSARYENTARTAYGTAGTGTFVSGGAVKDMVCIVGRDSTHYLTTNFNGTWTAN